MDRILAFVLSGYWMAVFGHAALESAGHAAATGTMGFGFMAPHILAAMVDMVVVALFFWVLTAAAAGAKGVELEELTKIAAIIACAVIALRTAASGRVEITGLLQLLALAVTFVVVRLERLSPPLSRADATVPVARLMAVGAADMARLSPVGQPGVQA